MTVKSRFQTWNFPKQRMGGSSKDSHQNFHLRRSTQGNHLTFHRTINFSFGVYVSVCRRAVVLNPVHYITQDLGCCQEQKAYTYISTASLQELKELGKYEYFFRVYHNNETDQGTVDLGLSWTKVKRPIILSSSLAL